MRAKRLSRSLVDRTFGGVCGGLGHYLNISSWWVRGAFVIFTLLTFGVSLLLYLALWFVMPQQTLYDLSDTEFEPVGQANAETLILLGGGTILLGLFILAVNLDVLQGSEGDVLLPFTLLGLGMILLAQQLRRTR